MKKNAKSIQKSIRIPREVWEDVEAAFASSRFRKMSQFLVYLLEEGVVRATPAGDLARRQVKVSRRAKRKADERPRRSG